MAKFHVAQNNFNGGVLESYYSIDMIYLPTLMQ